MRVERFEMERWQSLHEHKVRFNLSESGVEPVHLAELITEEDLRQLLRSPQGYAETRGSEDLRSSIASTYPSCEPENVLVTTGTAEANFIVSLGTMEPGARVVTLLPNYMQVWGLARTLWCHVEPLFLREDLGWQLDEEEVKRAITRDTTVVSLSNPNNPSGACLSEESLRAILDAVEEADAWLLVDEVYRGAEREGPTTPSLWGRYEKVLVTCGLSKAYGLPGLRLGWICGPEDATEEFWSIHDYTTISVSGLAQALGVLVLTSLRETLIERARSVIRRNYPILEAFIRDSGLSMVPPRSGAIALVRYPWRLPSIELAERALLEDVLILPGAHFHLEGFLRLGFGMAPEVLKEGLSRLRSVFREVSAS